MKILPLLLIVVLLGGCAAMGPTDPYASVKVRKVSSTGFDVAHQAPRIPKGLLTLQQAIETALANNPEVAARKWDASAAQARRDQAFGARLPRLGVVGGYTRYLDDQRLMAAGQDGEPGLFGQDIVSGDLVLTMPLFTGGRLVNQVRAAELLQEAAVFF